MHIVWLSLTFGKGDDSQFKEFLPKGLDSTSVVNIFKNTTTLFNFRNMFRCFKHHQNDRRYICKSLYNEPL